MMMRIASEAEKRTPRRGILKTRIVRLLTTVGVVGLSSVSSGQTPAQNSNLKSPIVIGVSNVQSGPPAALGKQLLEGSRAYLDLVNSSGGIHGRKIDLLVRDDHYEPDPAVQNTNDLIARDKVFFL